MNRLQIAILGVGLLLAPWLMLAATRPSKPLPTLVGVPAEDRDLSAPVAELFGKAPYFMVADLRTSTAKAVKNPYWRDRGAMGLKSAYLLLDEGVGAILVKSIRPAIHNAFYSRGVHVYDGNADTVYEAVQRFQNGAAADLGPPRLPHHMDASHIPVLAPPCPCLAPTHPFSTQPQPRAFIYAHRTAVPELGLEVVSGALGGATVVSVLPGSRALRAGLQRGDIIVGLGQTTVQDANHFRRLIAATRNAGIMLTVERDGTTGRLWILPGPNRFNPQQLAKR